VAHEESAEIEAWWMDGPTPSMRDERDDWRRPWVVQPSERRGVIEISLDAWVPSDGDRSCG